VNRIGDKSRLFSVVLNKLILETKEFCPVVSAFANKSLLQMGNWVETRHRISRLDKTVSKFSVADSLDLSPIMFTPPTRRDETRQDSLVLGGLN